MAKTSSAIHSVGPTSVYQVAHIVATHATGWEQAAAVALADLANTITDLRIARVTEKDVARNDDGTFTYRIKLAVSYRIDRHRVLSDGTITQVRRYLVVANETVNSDALHRAIATRVGAGPSEFHVLMPIRPQRFANAAIVGDPLSGYFSVEAVTLAEKEAEKLAQERLYEALERIRSTGATATGEIAISDPLTAASTVIDRSSFDEILLSTLPKHLSKWLGVDLHRRMSRHTQLPVVHVETPA